MSTVVPAQAGIQSPAPRAPTDLARALEQHFLSKLEYLNAIGIALSQERDINKLLETILIAAKNLTHADGGTLYRLIDGKTATEAQRKQGIIPDLYPYGRGDIDPDTSKKGLQVEFTVEDEGVFTTPWSARVTYQPVIGEWPEALCAENPHYLGTDAPVPRADKPDF